MTMALEQARMEVGKMQSSALLAVNAKTIGGDFTALQRMFARLHGKLQLVADAIDAHLTQPAQSVDVGLVERLRKRAAEERKIAENNARVAELLSPELALFNAREGHNIYATRMAIDHRDSAKRDAAFADDLETAADKLTATLQGERSMGELRALYEAASAGFHTSVSYGPENKYQHIAKFRTLEELFKFENAWLKAMALAKASSPGEPK